MTFTSGLLSGLVDLIDIELMSGNFHVVRLTTEAHEHGIACVVSNHDFTDTPRDDKIISMLRNMEILGADICKVVSMPANEFDVRRITELCTKVTRGNLHENNIRKPGGNDFHGRTWTNQPYFWTRNRFRIHLCICGHRT